jgi:ADP-ribose pyrophosphatase YjhB (NUDIX family)
VRILLTESLKLRREYPKQPLAGVGAVIINEGKIILVKRGVEPGKGEWSIPGGLIELGETVRDAVIREAKEETGLDVEIFVDRPIDAFDNIDIDEKGGFHYHFVLMEFLTRPKSGTLKSSSDAVDAKWVPLEEVEKYDLTKPFRKFFIKHKDELKEFSRGL